MNVKIRALIVVLIGISGILLVNNYHAKRWSVSTKSSTLYGEQVVIAKSSKDENGLFGIRCMSNSEVDMLIDAKSYLGHAPVAVRYRVGESGEELAFMADTSSDGRVVKIYLGSVFLEELLRGKEQGELIVGIEVQGKAPKEMVFDISRLGDAVLPYRKICGVGK